MKKEEIHLSDISRILFGTAPAEFLIEVLIRPLIIYLFLLVITRWLGKRMSGQITIMEMAVMLTLGATVSVAMQVPDRGLLPAVVVAMVMIGIQRLIAYMGVKDQSFEKFSQGNMSLLIKDSVIDLKTLESVPLSRLGLFAQLRGQSITHLGKVDRFYMEANGSFTLIKKRRPSPVYPCYLKLIKILATNLTDLKIFWFARIVDNKKETC